MVPPRLSAVLRGALLVGAAVALTAAMSRTLMPDSGDLKPRRGEQREPPARFELAQDLGRASESAAPNISTAPPGALENVGPGPPRDADRELALTLVPGLLEMGVAVPMGPNDDGQAVLAAVNGLRRQDSLPPFEHMDQTVADYVDGKIERYRARRAGILRAQLALDALGFDAGPIDGVLGPRTTAAIKRYQQRIGLPVTGELTDAQIDALERRSFDRAARSSPRG